MTQEKNHGTEKSKFEPANFPALGDYLPAYLHEEFADEYGTAAEAVKTFLADASGDDIQNLREEWTLFRKTLAGRPIGDVQHALEALGVAWHPETEQELAAIDEILSRAEA